MIVKMKFVSITGPKSDIDRVVNRYLSRYEIHLENALTELSSVKGLSPFIEENPYAAPCKKAKAYAASLGTSTAAPSEGMSAEDAVSFISDLDQKLSEIDGKKKELSAAADHDEELMRIIQPFRELKVDVTHLKDYKYIKYRFGRIPREFFDKFRHFLYENFNTYFYKCYENDQYVWGVYFMPKSESRKINALYSSLHFERIDLPDEYKGTPEEAYNALKQDSERIAGEIKTLDEKRTSVISSVAPKMQSAADVLTRYSENFDVRKKAVLTKKDQNAFFILCGWMAEEDVGPLSEEMKEDSNVILAVEESGHKSAETPPTKLKNPGIFKPYEMYVKMYGLPNYNEIDPTIFIAITYSFIFGAMFGDFGQGLCLLIGGFLLYKFRHITLAGIISCAGVFSTIFGWLFGSFFGFENSVIKTHWLSPKTQMMHVNKVGNINTVLVCAIVFGMFLILVTMVLHIINAVKQHNLKEIFFGTNSITGFVFYVGVIIAAFTLFGSGKGKMAAWVVVIFIVIPLILMFFKDPLTKVIEKHKGRTFDEGVGMFIVQSFFEMFEVLLSFFSNTLSFVRIGAFAVSHAAMMEVVLMLAGAANGGSPNWAVIVLGNLFVMGMEGLIVGIQVLRLEYYELFSRFYSGDGKPFVPAFHKAESTGRS